MQSRRGVSSSVERSLGESTLGDRSRGGGGKAPSQQVRRQHRRAGEQRYEARGQSFEARALRCSDQLIRREPDPDERSEPCTGKEEHVARPGLDEPGTVRRCRVGAHQDVAGRTRCRRDATSCVSSSSRPASPTRPTARVFRRGSSCTSTVPWSPTRMPPIRRRSCQPGRRELRPQPWLPRDTRVCEPVQVQRSPRAGGRRRQRGPHR